jgi:hypothetical protein
MKKKKNEAQTFSHFAKSWDNFIGIGPKLTYFGSVLH